MSDIAIKFENISKQYRLGLVSTKSLSHDINRWWQTAVLKKEDPYLKIGETNDRTSKGESEYVWALRDISFDIKKGDVLGIIGRNGAGKSTLLKILSRVTTPTTGIIKAQGRIASLLEVGTGFHRELTGRENIFMNGSIMGMNRKEIQSKLDQIVDFAGVARYIDTPVKRYSSGMTVRLGFSIAAHLEPEILVVDEVLAVGDAEFQKKAIGKMQDVSKGEGRTVLFVSHNMGAIKNLCNKGVVLKNGQVFYTGNVNDAVNNYLDAGNNSLGATYENPDAKASDIKKIEVVNRAGNVQNTFGFNEEISLRFNINVKKEDQNTLFLGINVKDQMERIIFTTQTQVNKFVEDERKNYNLTVKIPHSVLLPNKYSVTAALHIPNIEYITLLGSAVNFSIEETGSDLFQYAGADNGCIYMKCDWAKI
ncbi:MAG: ABC transporter ATP-binding protein [Dysgonamonadaceae bacterium]|jgi:lipopolysaccharide transport system ATP-binding protein|nr:ABC transporter ATP-binding protein [Dysgonamonadaceae bacterium]